MSPRTSERARRRLALPAWVALTAVLAGCAPAVRTAPEAVAVSLPEVQVGEPVVVPAFLLLQGRLEQGALIVGQAAPGAQVSLDGRALRVDEDGLFVFGLDRDAPSQVSLAVSPPQGAAQVVTLDIAPREYRIQRVTGISQKIMTPSKADAARAQEEAARVAQARTRDDDRTDFMAPFAWPADGPVTGVYGSQRYYNGEPGRPHYGVDVGVPTGTPVTAPAGGIVTLVHPDMFYSGGTLVIDHGHGVSSTLMHLETVLVREGDRVERGQPVATSGASGRASGPHLDWRMNWFDVRIDAQQFVPPR